MRLRAPEVSISGGGIFLENCQSDQRITIGVKLKPDHKSAASETAAPRRRTRGGGGAARRAERTAVSVETAKYIERNIPNFEVLNDEALQIIEANAETVLAEIGVNFVDDPKALERWRAAGAEVEGERVRIPRGLARQLCATAPASITQHARNPDRSVEIGGKNLVIAPVYGPPFVRDADGTLTQVLAEVLAGVAYSQLIRPGAPVIFGAFVTSIDMNSGAPTFGTPEASHITYGAGQLARRLGLPYRSAGSFCGSKLPDAQAAYETANSLNMGLLSGVNFMLHGCGWLEGGLVSSFEKFVMDADQLGALHHFARGVSVDENAQAMGALEEVGPGGHFLGCEHTQNNFKTAFWRSDLFDYKPFETWADEGERDTMALASARVEKLLADYQQPMLDPAIDEALRAYVRTKKDSMPDAFI